MLKMMTYSEANSILGSSLTPTNRCLTKSVAISAGAAETPLADFTSNRLVPATKVEPTGSKYNIVFVDGITGEILSIQVVTEGNMPETPQAPYHDGYEFTSWVPAVTTATQDKIYTANYRNIQSWFVLSDYIDSRTWDGQPSAAYGTYDNPYVIKADKDGGNFTKYPHSIYEGSALNWACEHVEGDHEYTSVSPSSGADKAGVTFTFAQNTHGYNFTDIYKFTQASTGYEFYVKAISTSDVRIDAFDCLRLTYYWNGGADLDTATIINSDLNMGTSSRPKYLKDYFWGFNGNYNDIPNASIKASVVFAGDNTSTTNGMESVLIHKTDLVNAIKAADPSTGDIVDVYMYCNWYGTEKDNQGEPVSVNNAPPEPIIGNDTRIVISAYTGNDFQEVDYQFIPIGSTTLVDEYQFDMPYGIMFAADNLNYYNPKKYYTSVYKLSYCISKDEMTVSVPDTDDELYSKGIAPRLYVQTPQYDTQDNYLLKYTMSTSTGARSRAYQNKPSQPIGTAGQNIDFTLRVFSYTRHREVNKQGQLVVITTPRPFDIHANYTRATDNPIYVYDMDGNLLGTSNIYTQAIMVYPQDYYVDLRIHYECADRYDSDGKERWNIGIQQQESPEVADIQIWCNVNEQAPQPYDRWYLNVNDYVVSSYTQSNLTIPVSSYRTNSSTGSTAQAFKAGTGTSDWVSMYLDSGHQRPFTDSSSVISPTNPADSVPIYAVIAANTDYAARVGQAMFSQVDPSGLSNKDSRIDQCGRVTANINISAHNDDGDYTFTSTSTRDFVYHHSNLSRNQQSATVSSKETTITIANIAGTLDGHSSSSITYGVNEATTATVTSQSSTGQFTFTIPANQTTSQITYWIYIDVFVSGTYIGRRAFRINQNGKS